MMKLIDIRVGQEELNFLIEMGLVTRADYQSITSDGINTAAVTEYYFEGLADRLSRFDERITRLEAGE